MKRVIDRMDGSWRNTPGGVGLATPISSRGFAYEGRLRKPQILFAHGNEDLRLALAG